MALITSFSDDFNRTDAANLGGNWQSGYTSYEPIKIVSNVGQATTLATDACETVTAVSLPNDQWAEIVIPTMTDGGNLVSVSINLRAGDPTAATWYEFQLRKNSAFTSRIGYRLAGALQAGSITENATTWAAGDTLHARAQGTSLSLYRNGSLLLGPLTDSSLTAGKSGVQLNNQTAGLGNLTIDTFACGYFAGPMTMLLMRVR